MQPETGHFLAEIDAAPSFIFDSTVAHDELDIFQDFL